MEILFLCTGNSCRSQMAEVGVDISGHRPKRVDELGAVAFDLVVTVCSPRLAKECKMEDERLQCHHRVRDEIRACVSILPECLERFPC